MDFLLYRERKKFHNEIAISDVFSKSLTKWNINTEVNCRKIFSLFLKISRIKLNMFDLNAFLLRLTTKLYYHLS